MSTAVRPRPGTSLASDVSPRPTDVFVIFGITGDLANVMTFDSLYRLEARGTRATGPSMVWPRPVDDRDVRRAAVG